ncbi:MAG: hypothetical protein LUG56_07505, partial [Lachnospiraceae bacterium]|nr:hypothetical protein [Lachnospiraceae bacterium]
MYRKNLAIWKRTLTASVMAAVLAVSSLTGGGLTAAAEDVIVSDENDADAAAGADDSAADAEADNAE